VSGIIDFLRTKANFVDEEVKQTVDLRRLRLQDEKRHPTVGGYITLNKVSTGKTKVLATE
jgi:hypothetical protein